MLLALAGVDAGCHGAAPRVTPREPATITALVTEHCRDCHMRSVSDETPEALVVFDLDDPKWFAGIPSKSFYAFVARLLPFADPGMATVICATVDAELARRPPPVRHRSASEPAAPCHRYP